MNDTMGDTTTILSSKFKVKSGQVHKPLIGKRAMFMSDSVITGKDDYSDSNNDDTILYYRHNHIIKFQEVLNEIKEFNVHFKHNINSRYTGYESNSYIYNDDYFNEEYHNECEDKYLYNDDYDNSFDNDENDKLYGFTDDWESYWSSIYD